MRSQEETDAIVASMNDGMPWNEGHDPFPEALFGELTDDERDAKAVERWIELGRKLGYTFKRSTFVGNMNRRYTKVVCKGEHGIVCIAENQFDRYYWDWDVHLRDAKTESRLFTLRHALFDLRHYATLLDMMCEYAGCQRRTEAML